MPGPSIDGVRVTPATPDQLDSYRRARAQIHAFATPLLFDAGDAHARVYFALFDGTGNDARKDPEHISNVGLLAQQLDELGQLDPRVGAYYKEGPGTQGGLVGMLDKINGGSFSERTEAVYDKFSIQAARWLKEDPLAQISVIAVGFSRGAEQAAAFARLVDARGVQRPTARMVDTFLGQTEVYYNAPPLRDPGTLPLALGLYDPVSSGEPRRHDRRPAPSVVSGLQINAGNEFRSLFPSTRILGQGESADGRFLGVTTAGAHSDIGGGYLLNGLSHRNFNLMADYLNGAFAVPLITHLAMPEPAMTVVHDTPWYYHKVEGRKVVYSLEATGKLKVEALDPVFAPMLKARAVRRQTSESAHATAAVFTLYDTGSAAFVSIGRNEEIGRVLSDAGARLQHGETAPFALHDTDGNDVGWFEVKSAAQLAASAPLPDGSVQVTLDLSKAPAGAGQAVHIAATIAQAAERIAQLEGERDFPLVGSPEGLLGKVAMAPSARAHAAEHSAEFAYAALG